VEGGVPEVITNLLAPLGKLWAMIYGKIVISIAVISGMPILMASLGNVTSTLWATGEWANDVLRISTWVFAISVGITVLLAIREVSKSVSPKPYAEQVGHSIAEVTGQKYSIPLSWMKYTFYILLSVVYLTTMSAIILVVVISDFARSTIWLFISLSILVTAYFISSGLEAYVRFSKASREINK
jgi:hypothetical protein